MATSGELKYVRHSEAGFIVWPKSDDLWHVDVGNAVTRRALDGRLLSAGFARIIDGKAVCYGQSDSLGMSSTPGDSEALTRQLGLAA